MFKNKTLILFVFIGIILLCGLFFVFMDFDPKEELKLAQENTLHQIQTQEENESKKLIKGLFADYIADDENNTSKDTLTLWQSQEKNTTETNATNEFFANFKLSQNQILHNQKAYFDFFALPLKPLKEENLSTLSNKNEANITLELNTSLSQNDTSQLPQKPQNINFKNNTKKAKLAIIIDDIASKDQVKALKKTGLKLIPSFFPSDKNHPRTKEFAREFDFFMVHLPLAALHFKGEERRTLQPNDTQEHIDARIAEIDKDFVGLKFINNHTGSLFTSDEKAMEKLFKAFKKYNFIFVDSVTIGSSKAVKLAPQFQRLYIKRDIFLDNEDDVKKIKKELAKAVALAHKKGFAIAIAHPRKNTFKALEQSKDLLQSVELVYLNEVYEYD
ncbi:MULTISPECIES: divergent polysaccharide deacetylase family protein [unclassified Campylobacter]|uniref:divergent polysaccharide deacetylase family protein n=1 Tax=unclassified Campylobacter TaxID=2593542 RepID=UPI001EE42FD7|nr:MULTISPECIES: divergent polysaccharide deacetylase family protein [unclassified Campylobacter]